METERWQGYLGTPGERGGSVVPESAAGMGRNTQSRVQHNLSNDNVLIGIGAPPRPLAVAGILVVDIDRIPRPSQSTMEYENDPANLGQGTLVFKIRQLVDDVIHMLSERFY